MARRIYADRVERIILLPGLWLPGISLTVLQKRLEHAGFGVETLDYPSVTTPLEDTLANLRSRMQAYPEGVHLVGHSLGGMLAMLASRDVEDLPPGRIVCLASPVTGSAIAHELGDNGGAWMLGHSRRLLEEGIPRWDSARQLGMVAGHATMGLGKVVGHIDGDSDGTVALAETQIPGLTDHCTVNANHTGIVFSREAATQTVLFLHHGRFRQST